jgi:hypothetical protein
MATRMLLITAGVLVSLGRGAAAAALPAPRSTSPCPACTTFKSAVLHIMAETARLGKRATFVQVSASAFRSSHDLPSTHVCLRTRPLSAAHALPATQHTTCRPGIVSIDCRCCSFVHNCARTMPFAALAARFTVEPTWP